MYILVAVKEQKQPSRSVLRKRCTKNMQQIYTRAPMPKCDFDKVALLKLHYGMGVLLNIFRTPFPKNNSEGCFWRRTQCVLEKAALRKKSQKVIGGKLKVCLSFRKLNLGEIWHFVWFSMFWKTKM